MQIEKLTPMTQFVLELKSDTRYEHILNYAQFLTQPLTLGMFVPVDANGNYMEDLSNEGSMATHYYNQAKSKVLFEGWSIIGRDENIIEIEKDNENVWIDFFINFNDKITPCLKLHSGYEEDLLFVEQLISYELQLTPAAKKQIYGR